MPLTEYLRILWRRGWIMALLAIITAASAYLFSSLQTPVFESTVNVLVQPARVDFGLTQSAKILLDSYVAFMNTHNMAQTVIDDLPLDTTPDALLGQVKIASQAERFLIRIDVKSENGDLGNDIAYKWAELFVQWRNDENQKQRKEDRVEAFILDAPRYSLDSPKKLINTAAGGVLGLLLGGVIVFVLEYVEAGIVRTRDDIERSFDLPVLGVIPATREHR